MKNIEKFRVEEISTFETKDCNGGRLFAYGSLMDTICTVVAKESYEAFNDFLDK